MIPSVDILTQEITETTYPTKTYKINFASEIEHRHALSTNYKDALTIASGNVLSGFTIDENVVVSISYNTRSAGYELTQDAQGIVGLTLTAQLLGKDRINGYIDDLEAVIQAVYLILSTERYKFNIYSWDYGVELIDLIGLPMPMVIAELPRRIKEALTMDDRIDDVVNFEFERQGKILHTTCTVVSNIGNISTALEVAV